MLQSCNRPLRLTLAGHVLKTCTVFKTCTVSICFGTFLDFPEWRKVRGGHLERSGHSLAHPKESPSQSRPHMSHAWFCLSVMVPQCRTQWKGPSKKKKPDLGHVKRRTTGRGRINLHRLDLRHALIDLQPGRGFDILLHTVFIASIPRNLAMAGLSMRRTHRIVFSRGSSDRRVFSPKRGTWSSSLPDWHVHPTSPGISHKKAPGSNRLKWRSL